MKLEPNQPRHGWQQKATRLLEARFSTHVVWPGLLDARRALLRSQHGPVASAAPTALTNLESNEDRPPAIPAHPVSKAAPASSLVSAHAVVAANQAGARVATNVFVRDMDLAAFNALDGRRLEIVAGRGPHYGEERNWQWTTMVSPSRRDGSPKPRAANHDGAAVEAVRRKKETTYPELVGEGGRARLWVLAAEVGGRWNVETAQFLTALARARAQEVPLVMQGRAEAAWVSNPFCPRGHEGSPVSLSRLTGCSLLCVFV